MDIFIQFLHTIWGILLQIGTLLAEFIVAILSFLLVLARLVLNLFHLS